MRITADPDTLHTGTDADADADIVLIAARGNTWRQCTAEGKPDESKPGISNEFMREYLRSAYFDVQRDVALEDFAGLGTDNMPFRGVLVSTKGATVTLTGSKLGVAGGDVEGQILQLPIPGDGVGVAVGAAALGEVGGPLVHHQLVGLLRRVIALVYIGQVHPGPHRDPVFIRAVPLLIVVPALL